MSRRNPTHTSARSAVEGYAGRLGDQLERELGDVAPRRHVVWPRWHDIKVVIFGPWKLFCASVFVAMLVLP